MKRTATSLLVSVQDLSGEHIAIMLAMGLVLGTFPVYGCPTVLCLAAALLFRLNAPLLQLVNQLTSPLQLALVFPFAHVGERILGANLLGANLLGATHPASPTMLSRFSELTVQAITGWLCLSVPLGFLLYPVLAYALRGRRAVAFQVAERPAA